MDTYTNSYIVYARIDESGRVLDINSSGFVRDDWGVPVDEGVGDKYHHAQVNYIDGPLYTDDGMLMYKLSEGKIVERTEEEIAADRVALPAHVTDTEVLNALLGVSENE